MFDSRWDELVERAACLAAAQVLDDPAVDPPPETMEEAVLAGAVFATCNLLAVAFTRCDLLDAEELVEAGLDVVAVAEEMAA